MAKDWIKGALNPEHKGQFKAKAEKAGMNTQSYATKEQSAPGKTGKQARLALTLMGLRKKGK